MIVDSFFQYLSGISFFILYRPSTSRVSNKEKFHLSRRRVDYHHYQLQNANTFSSLSRFLSPLEFFLSLSNSICSHRSFFFPYS